MKSKQVALTAIFAALYTAIGYIFHPIGFLSIQVRVSAALIPLIAIWGYPATIGITIGCILVNLSSPLGLIDLLSPLFFLPAKYAIQRWGIKAVPLHTMSVTLWVPYMLQTILEIPFMATVVSVGMGQIVSELILGLALYKVVRNRIQ